MGVYRIELILDGKSKIQQMMNQAAGSTKSGMDKIKASAKDTSNALSDVGKTGGKIGSEVSRGSTTASNSLSRVRSVASNVFTTITQGAGRGGSSIGNDISRGSTTASTSLSRLRGVASNTFSAMKTGANAVMQSLDGIGGLISGVIGGFGAMQIAQSMWTGSTQKQFNEAYLQTKMSREEAQKYIKNIQDIVSVVPGDDTFMNTLLTGAVARQTSLTTQELTALGNAAADYMLVSQSQGKSMIETQMDLKEYVQTGNTAQMERDSILKNQIGTLEGQETVSGRILALNKALKDEGYEGLSTLDIATIKAEELKGKFQLQATTLGERVLPYIEKFLDFMLELDEKTGGLSTQMVLLGGGVVALGMALGPVLWSFKEIFGSVGGIKDKLTDITKKKHKVSFDCDAPCPSVSGGGSGKTTTTTGKGDKKGVTSYLPVIGKTIAGVVGGAAVGDVLSNYVVGPAFSGISSLLGGGTPFKAYHGLLDVVGLGNQDYQVLNYNKQITENAKQYSQNKDLGKVDWSLFDSIKGAFWGKGQQKGTQSAVENVDWFRNNVFNKISTKGIGDWIQTTGLSNLSKGGLPGIISGWLSGSGGTAHASSGTGGGKPSIMQDIFGEKGLLRGTPLAGMKIPQFKWPSVNEIKESIMGKLPKINFKLPTASEIIQKFKEKIPKINWKLPSIPQIIDKVKEKIPKIKWKLPSIPQIIDKVKEKIPKINWKLPTIPQIIQKLQEKIPHLNWKIPSVPQILSQTWQKITQLWWQIPSIPQILSQTWQKITQLVWQIPSVGSILGIIREMIPPFSWPWGPGPSNNAVGRGSSGGGGGVFGPPPRRFSTGPVKFPTTPINFSGGPRGPLTTMVSGEISRMSRIDQGNIAGAMGQRFKGINAFNYIADGISDKLAYEFYFGGMKSDRQVWDSGTCNCYDGAEFLMHEASRKMGLSTGLSNGVWNGTSIPHTWAVIGNRPFDMAAKLIRGHWNPPSGPGSFDQFMTDIGPGLEYISYGGHRVNPYDAISQGGNCFDMTLGVLGLARELWGMPGQMVWGHYDGMSHVWARIGNKDYDPTRMALVGSYNPPPQGPGRWPRGPGGDTFIIEFNGTVYGVEDLDNRTETMVKQVLEKREKKRREYSFGM